jgi:ATPase subunit of ABC transporter with duplicated ATPase domains
MIQLREVTLRRGVKVVLERASVTLQPGEKVGLVGRNGAGKSSLFSLLTGRLHADAGSVEWPPRWRLAEVVQEMPETGDAATEFVLQGDSRLMQAQAELEAAEASDDGEAMRMRIRRLTKPAASTRAPGPRPCCSAWASNATSSRPRWTAFPAAGACGSSSPVR